MDQPVKHNDTHMRIRGTQTAHAPPPVSHVAYSRGGAVGMPHCPTVTQWGFPSSRPPGKLLRPWPMVVAQEGLGGNGQANHEQEPAVHTAMRYVLHRPHKWGGAMLLPDSGRQGLTRRAGLAGMLRRSWGGRATVFGWPRMNVTEQ